MTKVDRQKMFAITTQQGLLYYLNGYEEPVTSLFCSLLKRGQTVVDVGASLGYYTLLAAKRVRSVVAFEPDPLRFRYLLENIKMNNWMNVKAYNLAVSDVDSLDQRTITLDQVLQEDIDLVKIDVEGMELEVLQGMKKFLAEVVRIICELHPAQLLARGHSVEEVSDLLERYGYSFYLINREGLVPTPCLLNDKRRHYYFSKQKASAHSGRGSRRKAPSL